MTNEKRHKLNLFLAEKRAEADGSFVFQKSHSPLAGGFVYRVHNPSLVRFDPAAAPVTQDADETFEVLFPNGEYRKSSVNMIRVWHDPITDCCKAPTLAEAIAKALGWKEGASDE